MGAARRLHLEMQRIYDEPATAGGYRVLIDRLWPRGISRDRAALDEWAKDVAPSPELRAWFAHQPARFAAFARRYRAELAAPPAAETVDRLLVLARRRRVTLLTANRDLERSNAGVLFAHMTGSWASAAR